MTQNRDIGGRAEMKRAKHETKQSTLFSGNDAYRNIFVMSTRCERALFKSADLRMEQPIDYTFCTYIFPKTIRDSSRSHLFFVPSFAILSPSFFDFVTKKSKLKAGRAKSKETKNSIKIGSRIANANRFNSEPISIQSVSLTMASSTHASTHKRKKKQISLGQAVYRSMDSIRVYNALNVRDKMFESFKTFVSFDSIGCENKMWKHETLHGRKYLLNWIRMWTRIRIRVRTEKEWVEKNNNLMPIKRYNNRTGFWLAGSDGPNTIQLNMWCRQHYFK